MRLKNLGLALLVISLLLQIVPIAKGQDIPVIVLSNVELVTVDESSAAITWVTNLPSDTRVQWGETEELVEELVVDESELYHMGRIDGLEGGTTYFYRVGSGGRWSAVSSFTTLSEPGRVPKLKFAIIADSHFDVDGRNAVDGFMYEEGPRLLESLVDELNMDPTLEFVVTLGDLTNGAEEDFEGFTETMDNLDVPWYPLLGNWDKQDENWLDWYTLYFNRQKSYYSFDNSGYHIIILDSAVYGETKGDFDSSQISWLGNDLEANSGKPTLIFMHHMPDRTDNLGLEESAKENLESLLTNRPNVISVHSGHIHKNIVTDGPQGQKYITTAAVVSYPIGYSIAKLYENGFTQAFHKIESELETSEESRLRLNSFSGSTGNDEEYLGTIDDRSIVVELPQNQPPSISFISLDPGSVLPGETSTITVSAFDPDGDDLTYIYKTTAGTIEGSGSVVDYYAPQISGTYSIFAKVFDGEFYSEEKSIGIEVRELLINHAPVIKKVTVDKTILKVNEKVEIVVSAIDEDNDDLTYSYEPSGGIIKGSGKKVEWQAPDYTGDFSINIKVSDGELESKSEIIKMSVVKEDSKSEPGWGVPGFQIWVLVIVILVFTSIIRLKKNLI